jgi:maltose O-acetyltransferase
LVSEAASVPPVGWTVWRRRILRDTQSLSGNINPRFALAQLCASLLPNYSLCSTRAQLYRVGGCDIGAGVCMQGVPMLLGSGPAAHRLHVRAGCIIAPLVTFGLDADITLGSCVSIGPGTAFHTATHAIGFGSRRMQLATIPHGITIEDGVWIGAHCVILPGVTVGRGSVVAAGAVVTETVPSNVLISGNPAVVRDSLPFDNR